MGRLALTLACGPYDRTEALHNGVVQLEGIDLTYLAIQSPPEIFTRMVNKQAFDVAEMGLTMHVIRQARGDFPFVALPVFPLLMFRHGYIFINVKSNIKEPKDLEGKRIGLLNYSQSAVIWIRGLLQHEYGVDLDGVRWFTGGVNVPELPNTTQSLPDRPLSLTYIGADKTLNAMLADEEIDALIGARKPDCLGKVPEVRRLFPNYREVEKEYYRRTGIFPIMHDVVIKASLYQEHPWIAESLYKGFVEAKRWALQQMRFSGAARYMLPWLFDDIEETEALFGDDPWPYGVEPNRKTLETLVQYLVEQGFLAKAIPVDELFVPIVAVGE